MSDSSIFDEFGRSTEEFRERERQRAQLKEIINPILSTLAQAEEQVRAIGVAGDEGRYHVARARMQLLELLHRVDKEGNTLTERNHREMERFAAGYSGNNAASTRS